MHSHAERGNEGTYPSWHICAEIAGKNYIDIAWLARKKDYQVTLKDDSLYLTDETYHSVKANTNAYYRYDRDSITR